MSTSNARRISIRCWIVDGYKIAARHWPIFATVAVLSFALHLVLIIMAPNWSPLISLPAGVPPIPQNAFPQGPIAASVVVNLILIPLLHVGVLSAATSAKATGQGTFLAFAQPFRRPLLVLVTMALRSLSILVRLLFLVVPGVIRSVRLSFAPLLVLRPDVAGPSEALDVSAAWVEGTSWRLFFLRGIYFLLLLPLLSVASASFALAGSARWLIAVAGIHVCLSVLSLGPMAAAYLSLGRATIIDSPRIEPAALDSGSGSANSDSAPKRRIAWIPVVPLILVLCLAHPATTRISRYVTPSLLRPLAERAEYDSLQADERTSFPRLTAVAFFADSSRVAIGTTEGIEIRSIPDLGVLSVVTLPNFTLEALAVSPSGEELAYAGDGQIGLVSLPSGHPIWRTTSASEVTSLDFDPTGIRLMCGSSSSPVIDIRSATDGEIDSSIDLESAIDESDSVRIHSCGGQPGLDDDEVRVQWDPTAEYAMASFSWGTTTSNREWGRSIVWNMASGEVIACYDVQRASFTDRRGFVSTIFGYEDMLSGERTDVYRSAEMAEWGVPWVLTSFEKERLVYPYEGGIVVEDMARERHRKIDLVTLEERARPVSFTLFGLEIALPGSMLSTGDTWRLWGVDPRSFAISPDLEWLLSWSQSRLRLWNLTTGLPRVDLVSPYDIGIMDYIHAGGRELFLVHGVDLGDLLIGEAGADGSLKVPSYHTLSGSNGWAIAVNADGSLCALLDTDGHVTVWDTNDWRRPKYSADFVPGDRSAMDSLGFSKDSRTLFFWTGDRVLRWTLGLDPEEILKPDDPLRVSLRGSAVCVQSSEGVLRFWNLETGEDAEITTMEPKGAWFRVSESGNAVAVATADEELLVYTLPDCEAQRLAVQYDGQDPLTQNRSATTKIRMIANYFFLDEDRVLVALIEPEDIAALSPTWDGAELSPSNRICVAWDLETGEQIFTSPSGRYGNILACPAIGGVAVTLWDDLLLWQIPTVPVD